MTDEVKSATTEKSGAGGPASAHRPQRRLGVAALIVALMVVSWILIEVALVALVPPWISRGDDGEGSRWIGNHPLTRRDPFERFLRQGRIGVFHHLHYWDLLPHGEAETHGGIVYRINSLGFNTPEFDPLPGEDVFRIVTMGDSTVFGWDLPREASYPSQLRAWLDEEILDQEVEVINAGIPGHTVKQGLILMYDRILALRPELVILSYGWNEAVHPLPRLAFDHTGLMRWGQPSIDSIFTIQKCWVIGALARFRLAARHKNDKTNYDPATFDYSTLISSDAFEDRLPVFEETLERMIEILTGHGIRIIIAPISAPPVFYEAFERTTRRHQIPFADIEAGYRDETRRLRLEELGEGGTEGAEDVVVKAAPDALDFNSIRGRGPLFLDNCHPSPRGYEIVVEVVGPMVRDIIRGGSGESTAGVMPVNRDHAPRQSQPLQAVAP